MILLFLFQAPLTLTASNNLDSSVMIASVQEFHNPNRRGATMRMNTDGLNYVSSYCTRKICCIAEYCDKFNSILYVLYIDVQSVNS